MRRGRIIRGACAVAVAAAVAAPGALAAPPQEIYKDYADNGRLDRQYSQADLQRAFKDVTLQGYKNDSRPDATVAGGSDTDTSPPLTTTRRSSSLPFTGAELGIFALVGAALVGSGVLLRLSARPKKQPTA